MVIPMLQKSNQLARSSILTLGKTRVNEARGLRSNRDFTRKSGFALVIALTLMGFMMLLVVSLVTLIQVETRSSDNQKQQAEARENARLGMLIALAELQKNVGPDRRVTARGDILDPQGVMSDGRRFWTGVWESAAAGVIQQSGGNHRKPGVGPLQRWLVSMSDSEGNLVNPTLTPGGANPLDSAWERVMVVGAASADADETVEVGLVPMSQDGGETVTGAFGWWIGDEGIKAKINIKDPYAGTTAGSSDYLNRMRVAQRFGIEAMDKGAAQNDPLGPQTIFSNGIERVVSLQSFSNVSPEGGVFVQQRFHDLTAHSSGLLVDVTTGRLKQDLTHAFEHDTVFNTFYPANSRTFNFREDTTFNSYLNSRGELFMPNMGILRSYHNIYKDLPSSGPVYASFQMKGGQLMRNAGGGFQNAGGSPYELSYHDNNPLSLIDARLQMSISVDFIDDNAPADEDAGDGLTRHYLTPRLKFTPTLVLYNPHNRAITLQETEILNLFNPEIEIQVGGNQSVRFYLFEVMPPQWRSSTGTLATNYLDRQVAHSYMITRVPEMTVGPGESLIYSLNESGYLYRDAADRANGIDGYNAVFGTMWRANNVRRVRSLEAVNDTTIGESFWVPLNADYIVTALSEGTDRDDTLSGNSTYRQLYTGTSRGRPNFGLTASEKERVRVSYTTDGEGNVEGGGSTSFSMRVAFNYSSGVHEQRARTADGAIETLQRYSGGRGLTFNSAERMEDQQWVVFGSFQQAEASPAIATWRQGLRTVNDELEPSRFIDMNPRAVLVQGDWEGDRQLGTQTDLSNTLPFSYYNNENGRVPNAEWEMPGDWDGETYRAFVGDSIDGGSNTTRFVLFDVPEEQLLSLGALQHANMGRYSFHPLYMVGQSYLPPLSQVDTAWRNYSIRPYNTVVYGTSRNAAALDLPYVLNNALWDRYFFSAIPQDLDDSGLQDILSGTEVLPNSRLTMMADGGTTASDFVDPAMGGFSAFNPYASPVTFNQVAGKVMMNGAFNINSTSVQAWKALLASTQDLELPVYDPLTGTTTYESGDGALYSRFSRTYGNDQDLFAGARRLSQQQIDQLAEAIVEEVKERGPFGSMADFVNRSLSEAARPEHKLSGALQSAIDRVNAINQAAVNVSGPEPAATLERYGNAYDLIPPGPQATGIPGFLLQSDLLQVLGPVMTPRSDTFVIRAHGDSRNPITGDINSQVWCEAVVQRFPDPVEPNLSGNPEAALINPQGLFGRNFSIVAFRWLNQNEI